VEVGVASLVVDVAAAVGLFAKRRPLLTGADFETVSTNLICSLLRERQREKPQIFRLKIGSQ